jgi:peptide/nickel transport system substrate-binding protein
MKKYLVLLALVLVAVLVLAGCGGNKSTATTSSATSTTTSVKPQTTTSAVATSTTAPSTTIASTTTTKPSTTTTAPSPSSTAKVGGTLQMVIAGDPSSFYPAKMTGQTDGQTNSVCLETLFRFDRQYNLVPLLATSWKADAAAKTITIALRQGVKFHDGSDFNAEACKWNLEKYRAGTRPELKKVTSIDVVDPYTVKLNLSEFDNTIVTNLGNASDAGRMISKAAFEKNGGEDWSAKNPVGTGPFQFVSSTKDVSVVWKRFDGYWAGKPNLDGIVMKRYADSNVALMDFKAGNLDILGTTAPIDAKDLQKDTKKYKVVVPPYGQVPALAGYATDPASAFSKLEMRQAISYAIDVKAFTENFGLGFWTVQNSWAVPGTASYNDAIVGYPFNPTKAKQLIAQATGSSAPFKTTLSFYNTGQSIVDENTGLQDYLNKAGFEVTLNPLQRPAFADMASNMKGWSGIVRQQGYSNPDPLIKYAGVMAGQEFKGTFLAPDLVEAYQKALTATDQDTKISLTKQFLAMAVDKYCISSYLCVNTTPSSKSTVVHDDLYAEDPFSFLSPFTWLSR